jgi:hypothetical protein
MPVTVSTAVSTAVAAAVSTAVPAAARKRGCAQRGAERESGQYKNYPQAFHTLIL